jgi:hypothetical protein
MSEKMLEDGDYYLKDGAAWLRVNNVSIRIYATTSSVSVKLFPFKFENEALPLDECSTSWEEVEGYIEEIKIEKDMDKRGL